MHSLLVGMTQSGKTTLAKLIAWRLKEQGHPVAVLDPFEDESWKADFITSNSEEFLEKMQHLKDHFIFVDETAQSIGRYNEPMNWLATTARHLGHSSFFICHRFTQLDPVIRANAERSFVFATDRASAEMLAMEWNQPELIGLPKFRKGQFAIVSRFRKMELCAIDFGTKKVEYLPNRMEAVSSDADPSEVSEAAK
jgi:tRNA uridine 5-carbamoylmethylation protein Kti12